MNIEDPRMPRARKDQLLVKELANETLVYDEANQKAHCLNNTAAFAWRHCDGRTSVAKVAEQLGLETSAVVSEKVIWASAGSIEEITFTGEPSALLPMQSTKEQ
jgi:Coenzyme PQQ synthesis protein D (PqqD)